VANGLVVYGLTLEGEPGVAARFGLCNKRPYTSPSEEMGMIWVVVVFVGVSEITRKSITSAQRGWRLFALSLYALVGTAAQVYMGIYDWLEILTGSIIGCIVGAIAVAVYFRIMVPYFYGSFVQLLLRLCCANRVAPVHDLALIDSRVV
jgi:hypothetical protein